MNIENQIKADGGPAKGGPQGKGGGRHPQGDHPRDALERLFNTWHPQPAIEEIALQEAAGRVLAEDLFSQLDVPSSRASRMDGIAVRSADFATGMPDTSSWALGVEYAYADMGDDFDERFDAVVPVESVNLSLGYPVFQLQRAPQPGDCINPRGGTLQARRQLASCGQLLAANNLAVLAMGGITCVKVLAKPRVAFIPTGSELVPLGQAPGRGQVVESNSLMARLALEEYGAQVSLYPLLRDDRSLLEAQLEQALAENDIVLFNGGTSKGSEDLSKPLLASRGTLTSHWMNSGPGRPVGAGVVDGKCVIAVPGPPAAMYNVMEYFVSSVIDRWYGVQTHRHTVRAVLTEDVECPPHMMMLVNARLSRGEDGRVYVQPVFFKKDSITALSAQGYFHSPIGVSLQPAGSEVEVSVFGTRTQGLLPYPYM